MELNVTGTIQAKVLEAESMNVPWSHERVWNQLALADNRKNPWQVPLAAAAVLVAGAVGFFVVQSKVQQVASSKIEMLQARIAQELLIKTNVADLPPKEVACEPKENLASRTHGVVREEKNKILPEEKKVETEAAHQVVSVNPDPVIPDAAPVKKAQPAVLAIVGVIPAPPQQSLTKTRIRKIKLQLFKPITPAPSGEPVDENKTLTARIN